MRALRISLVVLAVVVGLFIAADRIAVHLAEEETADKVKASQGLSGTESAEVSINGFPFLTQVFAKELDDVEVDLTGMTAGSGDTKITVTRVDARLTDVHLRNNYSSAVAEKATGTAKISYEDLNAIAPDGVEVSYAGQDKAGRNQVKLTASLSIFGRTVEIPKPIFSTVEITEDNAVQLHAEQIPGSAIPGAEEQIRERVDFGSDVTGLPSGITLEEAKVTKEGVTFTLTGTDVELGG